MTQITRPDSMVAINSGGSHTLLAGSNRVVVVVACAEHTSSGTHTQCDSVTYGGTAMTKEGGSNGFLVSGVYLGAELFLIREAALAAMGTGAKTVSGTWNQAGATNTFLIVFTLKDVNQSASYESLLPQR